MVYRGPPRASNNGNASRGNRRDGPQEGEIRVHKRTGLWYVWDFLPGTNRGKWMRWDTTVWNMWRIFPAPTARAVDLRRFNRRKLNLEGNGPTFVRVEFS